ncbi:MAG: hypothetical protein G01um101420_884 [Parcubacteria group bacterium Gr01-1014_20]|nr:MAG: hypothetical protein G01um101420_884 [Parcubacteria group bacterium Gr01-1014_20]
MRTAPVITDIEMHSGWTFEDVLPKPIRSIHLWKLDPLESTILETEITDPATLRRVEEILTPVFAARDTLPEDESFVYNPTFVAEIHGQSERPDDPTLFINGNIIMENMPCSTVCLAPEHDHHSTELWDLLETAIEGLPITTIPQTHGWIFKYPPIYLNDPSGRKRLFEQQRNLRKLAKATIQINPV